MDANTSPAPEDPGSRKAQAGNALDDPAKGFAIVRAADHLPGFCPAEIAAYIEMRVLLDRLSVASCKHGKAPGRAGK
jgi:hypothetical protein